MRIPLSQGSPGPLHYSILLASFLWELHYDMASQSTNVWDSISNPLSQVGTEAWAPYYLRRQEKRWTQTGLLRLEHKTDPDYIRVIITAVARWNKLPGFLTGVMQVACEVRAPTDLYSPACSSGTSRHNHKGLSSRQDPMPFYQGLEKRSEN